MSLDKNRLLALCGALLVANSAYLAASGDPRPFYFFSLLAHLALGLAAAALFLPWWWRRRSEKLLFASGGLLLASGLVAVVLLAVGNRRPTYFLVPIHWGLALAGLVGIAAWGLARRGGASGAGARWAWPSPSSCRRRPCSTSAPIPTRRTWWSTRPLR